MPPTLAAARLCLLCPYCATINAPHAGSPTWPCRKCHKEFETRLPSSFVEGKPDSDAKSVDLPVKLLGNEVPAWAVKVALGLVSFLFLILVSLVALRLASPEYFRSVVGAVSEVRASIVTPGSTVHFVRNLTFFVPGGNDAAAEGKWQQLLALLKEDGATGYTRWRVEGWGGGTETNEGHFVLISVPTSGINEKKIEARFHQVYGDAAAFFVINEQLH